MAIHIRAMGRPKEKWWLRAQPWFQRKRKAKALKAIRARDGDTCWRCGSAMRFDGPPNCGKAATIEHLLPLSKGGGWNLENLCLCHVGCNRHLADKMPEQKLRMRNTAVREVC